MAKPIREILNHGFCDVEDKGVTFTQNLPTWMRLDNQTLDNMDLLAGTLGEKRVHALIHKGLAQAVIDVRAKARQKDKAGKPNGNPEKYEPNLLPNPSETKGRTMSPAQALEIKSQELFGKALNQLTAKQAQKLLTSI